MEPNYQREFLKSPYHIVSACLTVGAGLLFGNLLGLIVGVVAYVGTLMFVPDLKFFRGWVNERYDAQRLAEERQQLDAFNQRRDRLLMGLTKPNQVKYWELVNVCKEIERTGVDGNALGDSVSDPRLRKLDELMWTFLRLLNTEEALQRFVVDEQEENLPNQVSAGRKELDILKQNLDKLKAANDPQAATRERVYNSRTERLAVLSKRLDRIEQANSNLSLVSAEQERLREQVKLIRSDTVAAKNADAFTTRIDASVEHLDETNGLLKELEVFRDATADEVPSVTTARIGYGEYGSSAGFAGESIPERPRSRSRQSA